MTSLTAKLRFGPGIKSLDEPLKSISEFDNWRHSVQYNLRLSDEFRPFLEDDMMFGVKTRLRPVRDLVDDPDVKDKEGRIVKVGMSAQEKCRIVDFMLETIVQYLPKIPHHDITRDCSCLGEVWQVVRLHSNIESSGALLNEAWNIVRLPNESPQALYSRIKQAYDDTLIRRNTLVYKTERLNEDEELSPTLHCTIILHWLQVLHPKLRDLVTQRFGTELRNNSYAALWPEISRSVESLLKELSMDGTVCKYGDSRLQDARGDQSRYPPHTRGSFSRQRGMPSARPSLPTRECGYCRMMNRRAANTHIIDDCLFLKRERPTGTTGASRAVEADDYNSHQYDYNLHEDAYCEAYPDELYKISPVVESQTHIINAVTVYSSPVMSAYNNNNMYQIMLDTGGSCNVMDEETSQSLNCQIYPTFQRARMADGVTELKVIGETSVIFTRNNMNLEFNALVCKMVGPSVIGGMPFLVQNDISMRPAKNEVTIAGKYTITCAPKQAPHAPVSHVRRIDCYTVRSPTNKIIYPGEETTFQVPSSMCNVSTVAVEPRHDNIHNQVVRESWPPPQVHSVKEGRLTFTNTTSEPIYIKKNSHVCNIQPPVPDAEIPAPNSPVIVAEVKHSSSKKCAPYSTDMQTENADISKETLAGYKSTAETYDHVFNPEIETYNNKAGRCRAEVNVGPQEPPQHNGKVPFYGSSDMTELSEKIDELVRKGVLAKPQDLGVSVEIVNPSFLVRKKDSKDKRFVTDFGCIADYCRPTPTLMLDVDSALRKVASWKFIVKMDLKEAYFQIPLKRSSMKYCGVSSPFKGTYVYTRACMGLPGSEKALEELTCLLFGDLVSQGKLVKLADDLIIGADNPEDLLKIFEKVLSILQENNLRLSAKKTYICPKSVMILGWIWEGGFLRAGPHRLSGLSECDPPTTVKGLKSYLGAYKFLSRVIRNYAILLNPLESMINGKPSPSTKLEWSTANLQLFKKAQEALKDAKSIALPRQEDVLQIVTDAAVTPTAVGAVMYVVRDGKPLLGGFYNAKLPLFQRRWLPCELEGVAIGAAINHFAPYFQQSIHRPQIFTDSKPCIQAVEKFRRGAFSASARLCTFLSAVSRWSAIVSHIQGNRNLVSDFISRNPVSCEESNCQVCTFLKDGMTSVVGEKFVGAVSVSDVLDGSVQLPFINKGSWLAIQELCPDLRNVMKYLRNGTTPGKKGKHMKLVKRYLSSKVVLSNSGVLVVRQLEPFLPVTERIVVPQQILHGIVQVLHINLNHPSSYQLHKVFNKFFMGLNVEKFINQCTKSCHQCASLREVPHALIPESSDPPPTHFAHKFAADCIKRNKQIILVLRECASSYTQADLIPSETAHDITEGLIRLSNLVRPSKLSPMSIRVDPHPSHKSMFLQIGNSKGLAKHNIHLEIGRALNPNKNPVAEKAVRELIKEVLNISPEGGTINSTTLSEAVASLNARIRAPGISAHEFYTQRDQTTGTQLSIDDLKLIHDQHARRNTQHQYSERSKAHNRPPHPTPKVSVGSLVFIHGEGSKLASRPRYIILEIVNQMCKVKRFTSSRLGSDTHTVRLQDCYTVDDEYLNIDLPPYPNSEEEEVEVYEDCHEDLPVPDNHEDLPVPDNHEDLPAAADHDAQQRDYPCIVCTREVDGADHAVQCDQCEEWCHTTCGGLTEEEYTLMHDGEYQWSCPNHEDDSGASSADGEDDDDADYSADSDGEAEPVQERPVRKRTEPDRFGEWTK